MSKVYRSWLLALALGLSVLASTTPAYAQLPTTAATTNTSTWLTIVPHDCQDANGCDICEITKVFTNAANLISSVLSGLSLLMFVIGGMFLIFSAGNETRVETGKKILVGTVTGLAIIFVAWLGVNILVRTVALSGGTSTVKVFSKNWWELEGCYPALPTTCKGLFVGEACGFNECGPGTTESPVCSCYRYVDPANPNGTKCEGDNKPNVFDVSHGADNPDKSCGCFTSCSALAGQTGNGYNCDQTAANTKAANDTAAAAHKPPVYTVRTDVSCADTSKVCSLAN